MSRFGMIDGEYMPEIPESINKRIDAFLEDIFQVYEKHNFSISHEDGHGGFVIEVKNQSNINWLKAASLEAEKSLLEEYK